MHAWSQPCDQILCTLMLRAACWPHFAIFFFDILFPSVHLNRVTTLTGMTRHYPTSPSSSVISHMRSGNMPRSWWNCRTRGEDGSSYKTSRYQLIFRFSYFVFNDFCSSVIERYGCEISGGGLSHCPRGKTARGHKDSEGVCAPCCLSLRHTQTQPFNRLG